MSDIARAPMSQEFDLRPEDLIIEDRFARRWTGDEEQEARRIEGLAKAIDKVGQLYPALVTPTADNKGFVLIDGHRRRRAILLVNDKRTQEGKELLKVAVRLETGGDLVKKSLIANIEREGYGPMELALRIQELRTQKKWEGFKGSKRIADYLGIDVGTVTSYEKFLGLNTELQEKLGEGIISAQSALELIGVPTEEQPKVLKRAGEIQKETDKKLTPRSIKRRQEIQKKTGKPATGRIERPAIREAIREKKGAKSLTLTRKELLDSIQMFDGPQYGHPNGAVRSWASYFTDVFAVGKGSVQKMRKLFDRMTQKAGKGTPVKEEAAPAPKVRVLKKVKAKAVKARRPLPKKSVVARKPGKAKNAKHKK
jgi:ParB/RepB/Spo0J family partition protein